MATSAALLALRSRLSAFHGLAACIGCIAANLPLPCTAGPRLDQIQVLGSHNSYHVAPHPAVATLIAGKSPELAQSIAYTHRPLRDQLERLGLRQLELDLYADPEGGRFHQPQGAILAEQRGSPPIPRSDAASMREPGTKILHVPDFDYLTQTPTLKFALQEIADWSSRNPAHVPVFVLLELKSDAAGPEFTQPLPWTPERVRDLEREILSVVPRERVLCPDDVRGAASTLRDAVRGHGWPSLADTRGRVVFLLDNTDAIRDRYLEPSPVLAERLFFVSVEPDHPAAAWFKLNDPIADFDRIRRLVSDGFMVRTRADADLAEGFRQEFTRRDAAIRSGAQLISTDFPEPNPSLGGYAVQWPGHIVARRAAGVADGAPESADLEDLAVPGHEPYRPRELSLLNARAMALHLQRNIGAASRDYARVLSLEPARPPSAEQERAVLTLAPSLRTVAGEPFALRDLVALHHPDASWVAYHLFWEDDIDFPEDNDPADHEVIWVQYDPATLRAERVVTYFHGALVNEEAGPGRPVIGVEWGKHGSLPLRRDGTFPEPAGLRQHWDRLHTTGTRKPDHPLAASWPRKFKGEWDAYRAFTQPVSGEDFLRRRRLLWTSRWANATLNQHALPYNFAAKTEWPPAVSPTSP